MKKKSKVSKWSFKKAWNAKTPIFWAWIRNASIFILGAVPTIQGLSTQYSWITPPQWFSENTWYIMSGATFLLLFAQTRQKKDTSK